LTTLTRGRHWLLMTAAMTAAASAQPPAPPPPPPPPPLPDESFIEFLGADDVGDAGWWEFLKHAEPRGDAPPAPAPPQSGKQ
jgi:hypothetical protein